MESLTEKLFCDKRQGNCTVDRNIEAESASKSPKKLVGMKKGNPV